LSGWRTGWGDEEQLKLEKMKIKYVRARKKVVIINFLFFTGYKVVYIPSLGD